MESAGHHATQRIAVVGGAENPEKVKVRSGSPTMSAQQQVWRITAAAENYRLNQQFTLSCQAYKAAADLQVQIWTR